MPLGIAYIVPYRFAGGVGAGDAVVLASYPLPALVRQDTAKRGWSAG